MYLVDRGLAKLPKLTLNSWVQGIPQLQKYWNNQYRPQHLETSTSAPNTRVNSVNVEYTCTHTLWGRAA